MVQVILQFGILLRIYITDKLNCMSKNSKGNINRTLHRNIKINSNYCRGSESTVNSKIIVGIIVVLILIVAVHVRVFVRVVVIVTI